jgi:D-sedoheptulose 7-phosphate isomerase
MNTSELILAELTEAQQVLTTFLADPANLRAIESAAQLMAASLKSGGKLLSCGNGGSMCDAMHFAEELSGRFRQDRKALAALSLSDSAHISCVANDYGYDFVFARGVEALGRPEDILLAISTSGNSINVLRAAETAKRLGLKVVSLTGKDGGELAKHSDIEIRVPHFGFADRIQEIHIKVIHILILLIEKYTA